MSPATHEDWNHEDFFCAHCLTQLDRWARRCYCCDASFHGAGRFDLLSGVPCMASVLHRG